MGVSNGIEAAAARLLRRIGASRALGTIVLLALTAIAYWPGHVLLPPVDRTEVVYAESSREMLREGRFIDPRYAGERERHRPIGTFWLQMASAKLLGPAAENRISTYRLPSLIGVTIAVLATFWLLAPLLGGVASFLAAGFAAVSPIVALESQLAITEGITLGLAALAQLALLRVYVAKEGERIRGLALLLWASLGVSITLNALAVPLLSAATLIALSLIDRRRSWATPTPTVPPTTDPSPQGGGEKVARGGGESAGSLWRRLEPAWGVPLMIALGAAWPTCLVLAEGGWPYHGLTLREFLGALGGSQAMKFRALPLSFTLAFIAGSLPFVLVLWPALRRLWAERMQPVERFLMAWIAGYLVYLELISSKPALYTVPVLMPAAAAAVALALVRSRIPSPRSDGERVRVRGSHDAQNSQPPLTPTLSPQVRGEGELTLPSGFIGWPAWIAVAGWPALVFALHRLTETAPTPGMIAGAAVVMLALAIGAWAAHNQRAALWAISTIAGFALFLGFTFGKLLPGLEKGWPTEMIAKAVEPLETCAKGDVGVMGYREPSAVFAFGAKRVLSAPNEVAEGAGLLVVERTAASPPQAWSRNPVACAEAVNFTRGCSQSFAVYARDGDAKCPVPPQLTCGDKPKPVRNLPPCR